MEKRGRMTGSELVTVDDLHAFKTELFAELVRLLSEKKPAEKKWLKTCEVKKLLNMSSAKLHVLRSNGQLPFTRIGGIIYYDQQEISKMFERNKNKLL